MVARQEELLIKEESIAGVLQGDSGGPLTVDVDGKHVLIGDVSFGNKCGLAGKYGVYGDVAFFKTWIDTNVGENGGAKYCPA